MAVLLAILFDLLKNVLGGALWDLCKIAYKKRRDDELTLLNLFKPDQIQTLGLSAFILRKSEEKAKIALKKVPENGHASFEKIPSPDRVSPWGFSDLSIYRQCPRQYIYRQYLFKKI